MAMSSIEVVTDEGAKRGKPLESATVLKGQTPVPDDDPDLRFVNGMGPPTRDAIAFMSGTEDELVPFEDLEEGVTIEVEGRTYREETDSKFRRGKKKVAVRIKIPPELEETEQLKQGLTRIANEIRDQLGN